MITGANRGIGLETARQLGELDYTVLVGSRDKDKGESAAASLKRDGIDAHFIQIDPTNKFGVSKAVSTVEEKYGLLDVLINNAGIFLDADKTSPSKVSTSVLQDTYAVNVFGVHEVMISFWNLLNKSKAARVVIVSSGLGSLTLHTNGAFGDFQFIGYDSLKAAVNMMTIHYAHEWKNTPHRVNTIHPGSVKTDMNKGGGLSVEEGAKTSVSLATIGADDPNGGFFHLGETVPW